jgi:general secretion pathway protein L
MPFLATIIDELAAMVEPLRLGRRRAKLMLVERDGRYECYRNRRRPVLLARGDFDTLAPGTIPREMLSTPVEIRLDTARVLSKVLQLPEASRNYLDAIVTHQLERMTPWTADRVVFDYTLAGDDAAGKDQIAVRLVAIARDSFDAIVERLKNAGIRPSLVGTTEDPLDQPSQVNLLGISRAARRAALRRAVATGLMAVVLAGVAGSAFAGWRLYLANAEAAAVHEAILATRRAVEAALSNSEAAEGYRRLLAMKEGNVPMVVLLDRLSEVIPSSTYLTEYTVEGEELRLAGFSSEAPALIGMLEETDLLTDVRFGAPTTREEGAMQDRFEIVARIVTPEPPPDAGQNEAASSAETPAQ